LKEFFKLNYFGISQETPVKCISFDGDIPEDLQK